MKLPFTKQLSKFLSDERGVTLVEYAISLTLAIVLGGTALRLLAGAIAAAMGDATVQMPQ
jgi:Flp pilus assembly pilin Flp